MLLQKIELLLDKTPEDAIRNHIVQFAFNSLADTNTKIQVVSSSILYLYIAFRKCV
jgi:hypothetical protein